MTLTMWDRFVMWANDFKSEAEYRFWRAYPDYCYKHRVRLSGIDAGLSAKGIDPYCSACYADLSNEYDRRQSLRDSAAKMA